MSKLSRARQLRKAQNLGKKAANCVRESIDFKLIGDGHYVTADGVQLSAGILPTFYSTSASRAKQAAEYAKLAAHRVFLLHPELRG